MSNFKNILGIISICFTLISYIPYIRSVINGKTQPHVFSWFVWGLVTLIVFGLQLKDGAGIGAFVMLAVGLMCAVVMILGLLKKGKKDITKTDVLFLALALLSLFLWLVADQPVLSVILATTTDLLGFIPTIRKSWHQPHSEMMSFYGLAAFRHVLTTLSLQNYTMLTALNPVFWIFGNGLFTLMLYFRRRQIKNHNT